jgi:tRNA A-37 threonylcarbamoyl transferase component Bud32
MTRPADWHLLFGLLALQNGLVNRESLVASFAKWTSDKRKSIDQWLVDDGALTNDRRDMLVMLVDLHVQRHGNDVARSLASLDGSSVPRARIDLSQFNDPELARSIAQLPKVDMPKVDMPKVDMPRGEIAAFATVAPQQEGSSLSRFRILRPLEGGKGGMGEISIAEDQEVGRQVALKQIRTDCADSMSHRLKFQLEAEITGNLEHPGIVPIYSLGKDPSGRPFYAMRLVRGDNLNRAIDEFHRRGTSQKPDYVSVEFLTLIDRLIDVAQAISYAHSRGVLHRDLKPGNILVGNFGETLVIDWGLVRPPQAKQQSGQQVTEEVGQVNSEPFRVLSVRFTPDSKRLISGSRDRTVRFWNLITGEETFVLDGPSGPVSEVAINRDTSVIAVASYDQALSLWYALPQVEPAPSATPSP